MLKIKCDENLPAEVARFFADAGHDALTVLDQGLRGASDVDLALVCKNEDRVLISFDLDFADIRTYSPADFAGIVVLRLESQGTKYLMRVLPRLMTLLEQQPSHGKLWVVDETTVRIRG